MLTVTKLARRCGVSRTALLYYESIGLMPPPQRTGGNYRCYSEADAERLRTIRAYRNAGLTLEDIRDLLKTHSAPRPRSSGKGKEPETLPESFNAAGRTGRRNRSAPRPSARHPATAGLARARKGRNDYQGKWVSIMPPADSLKSR